MSDKIRCNEYIQEIQNEFNNYIANLQPYAETINTHPEVKYVISYINVLICYGQEAAFLYNRSWNTSIEPITRDFLECYEVIKTLISLYNTNDYNEYIRYLYYLDINQTMSIVKDLGNDNTITPNDAQLRIDVKLGNIKFIIQKFFPEHAININDSDLAKSISSIYNLINKTYSKCQFAKAKSKLIGDALANSQVLSVSGKPYEGSYVIYKELCHATHNNISSIYERTINNGMFMINTEATNVLASLCLICYCMKDVNSEIAHLLQSI